MKINPVTLKDFYKVDHRSQYPRLTELVYSNFTPRSNKLTNNPHCDGKLVFFGLQGVIKWFLIDLWNDNFFNQPKEKVLKKYKRRIENALGKDAITFEHIEALHDLGYLPLEIKALPEGSVVDMKIPVFTVKNTHPGFFWLTNMLETSLSAECWKTSTTATTARAYYNLLKKYAVETGSPEEFIPWQGHDFSMRGMSGVFDAAQSNAAHLLYFTGTDSIPAIDYLEEYYNADSDKELIGGSVPATEHSVMCMGGAETEIETFKRLITETYPKGIVSIVSDTWDFWKVLTEYAPALKDDILNREPDGLGQAKVVFRPDSGDPVKVICGIINTTEDKVGYEGNDYNEWRSYVKEDLHDKLAEQTPHGEYGGDIEGYYVFNGKTYLCKYAPDWNRHDKQYYFIEEYGDQMSETEATLAPEQKGAVECLWDEFGGTVNEAGYKVLNERVGLIYGDSITLERAEAILEGLKAKGFASCNIVFGIGSFTYQHVTRDTYGFAMKATYGIINGSGVEIFKDPVTDTGTKKSAKGLLRVEKEDGKFVLYDQQTWEQEKSGELKTVFLDGKLIIDQSLAEIRERVQ